MKIQNYKNHGRTDAGWLVAFIILLGMTIMTVSGLAATYYQ